MHFAPRLLVLACLCVLMAAASFVQAQAPADSTITIERDVVYGKVGDTPLLLNIAYPKDTSQPAPCVVAIHGGAWRAGNRKDVEGQVIRLAHLGFVAATVSYRFCPEAPFPAQIQDVKCAVRFLRTNAVKYGIDPARFGAVGWSAGAHLAMLLGTMDDADMNDSGGNPGQSGRVQAVVSFFGPTDLTITEFPAETGKLVADFIGKPRTEETRDLYLRASPIHYLHAGGAPILLLQGAADPIVPYTQATSMLAAMQRERVPGRLELIEGAGHGWGGAESWRTDKAAVEFLQTCLKATKAK